MAQIDEQGEYGECSGVGGKQTLICRCCKHSFNWMDDPSDMNRFYDGVLTAISRASDRSNCNRNAVIAVWDNENRCVAIFINGDQFNAS